MKNYTLGAAFVTAMLFAGSSSAEYMNPIDYPQSGDPTDIQVVIEIPAGTFTKYEIDGKTGLLFVDRFQSMPVVYPTNYGSIPSTVGQDADPLDALVITRQPIYPGALIRVRPVGILKMIDGGDIDDKIVAVPSRRSIRPTTTSRRSTICLRSSAPASSSASRCTRSFLMGGKSSR